MVLTSEDVYSVRFGPKLPLPAVVQSKIAKLRITPVAYKPVRPFNRHNGHRSKHVPNLTPDNWRERILVEYVRRVKEREDPEYSDIFSIFNKISPSNVDKLSADALVLIQQRDETFRLRVSMLLFDKAITQNSYSGIMAECAARLNDAVPEIADDLQSQISMFPTLYNMLETTTFPDLADAEFDAKVIEWTKQKEKRRGYAKFMMELYSLDLITEESVRGAFQQVVRELNDSARQAKTNQTEENTTQFVSFLFECSKKAKLHLKEYLRLSLEEFLKVAKAELPSLNMRSKFKLEDALKELNKEEKS